MNDFTLLALLIWALGGVVLIVGIRLLDRWMKIRPGSKDYIVFLPNGKREIVNGEGTDEEIDARFRAMILKHFPDETFDEDEKPTSSTPTPAPPLRRARKKGHDRMTSGCSLFETDRFSTISITPWSDRPSGPCPHR